MLGPTVTTNLKFLSENILGQPGVTGEDPQRSGLVAERSVLTR